MWDILFKILSVLSDEQSGIHTRGSNQYVCMYVLYVTCIQVFECTGMILIPLWSLILILNMTCCTKLEDYIGTRAHRLLQDPLPILQEQAALTLLWAAGLVPGLVFVVSVCWWHNGCFLFSGLLEILTRVRLSDQACMKIRMYVHREQNRNCLSCRCTMKTKQTFDKIKIIRPVCQKTKESVYLLHEKVCYIITNWCIS